MNASAFASAARAARMRNQCASRFGAARVSVTHAEHFSSEGPEHTHVFRDISHGLDELHVPEDDLLRGLAIATNGAAAQPHLDYFREALAEIQGKYDIRTGRRSA